jgi:hypothetical protein
MTEKDLTVAELAHLLRDAHKASTPGKWRRGRTSHHTVTDERYHIAEFHHACDASFCDEAHLIVPIFLDAVTALVNAKDAEIAALKEQLASFARGVKISIPTDTMEHEFHQHYKRGVASKGAEIAALRKDAERYRWLRSDDSEVLPGQREICVIQERLPHTEDADVTLIESELDAAIDAATSQVVQPCSSKQAESEAQPSLSVKDAQQAEIAALRQVINDAWASYERYGETSVLEGQPLIYASVLEEIHAAAIAQAVQPS